MKKSKKIERLKADNEHLYKLLRELMDENEALFSALFNICEIAKSVTKFPIDELLATGEVVRHATPNAAESQRRNDFLKSCFPGVVGVDQAKPGTDTTKRVAIWAVPEWVRSMQKDAPNE